MAVNTPCVEYDNMKEANSWDMIHALTGGTQSMREYGKDGLPQENGEEEGDYERRLARSFLHNAFNDTVKKCTARPFSVPITWDKVNDEVDEQCMEDMDGEGQDLQSFAVEGMNTMIRWGMVHMLEDYPIVEQKTNKKDDQVQGLKPFSRIISPYDLIGWRYKKQGGTKILTEIRILETDTIEGEDWEDKETQQVRVIRPDSWELWRPKDPNTPADEWKMEEGGTIKQGGKQNGIPLVTVYANKTGFMQATPCLLDLAWANLEHWQSLSDQKNILRVARFAILFARGFSPEELEENKVLGPTKLSFSENEQAVLEFVEHTGAAINSGFTDIERIEERMMNLGMEPFLARMGNVKATGQNISETKSRSLIEMWIYSFAKGLKRLFELKHEFMKKTADKEMAFTIHSDFILGTQASQNIREIQEARKAREISHETYIKEMIRHGVFSDTVDWIEERKKLQVEATNLYNDFFSNTGNNQFNQNQNQGQQNNNNQNQPGGNDNTQVGAIE